MCPCEDRRVAEKAEGAVGPAGRGGVGWGGEEVGRAWLRVPGLTPALNSCASRLLASTNSITAGILSGGGEKTGLDGARKQK